MSRGRTNYYPVFAELWNEVQHLPHGCSARAGIECTEFGFFVASVSFFLPDKKLRRLTETFSFREIEERQMSVTNLLRGLCNRAKQELHEAKNQATGLTPPEPVKRRTKK